MQRLDVNPVLPPLRASPSIRKDLHLISEGWIFFLHLSKSRIRGGWVFQWTSNLHVPSSLEHNCRTLPHAKSAKRNNNNNKLTVSVNKNWKLQPYLLRCRVPSGWPHPSRPLVQTLIHQASPTGAPWNPCRCRPPRRLLGSCLWLCSCPLQPLP